MKDRESTIAFEMDYCQHYGRGKGSDMVCAKGVDLKTMQKVPTGEKGIRWVRIRFGMASRIESERIGSELKGNQQPKAL